MILMLLAVLISGASLAGAEKRCYLFNSIESYEIDRQNLGNLIKIKANYSLEISQESPLAYFETIKKICLSTLYRKANQDRAIVKFAARIDKVRTRLIKKAEKIGCTSLTESEI